MAILHHIKRKLSNAWASINFSSKKRTFLFSNVAFMIKKIIKVSVYNFRVGVKLFKRWIKCSGSGKSDMNEDVSAANIRCSLILIILECAFVFNIEFTKKIKGYIFPYMNLFSE